MTQGGAAPSSNAIPIADVTIPSSLQNGTSFPNVTPTTDNSKAGNRTVDNAVRAATTYLKIDESNFTYVVIGVAGSVLLLLIIVIVLSCFLCCRTNDENKVLHNTFDVESAKRFKSPTKLPSSSVFDASSLQLAQAANDSGFMKATLPVDPNESVSFHESQFSGRGSQLSGKRKPKLKTWEVLRPLNLHTKYYGNFLANGVETVDEFVNLSDAGIAALRIEVKDMARIKNQIEKMQGENNDSDMLRSNFLAAT